MPAASDSAVPCLAGLYRALGADPADEPPPPPTPALRRAAALLAAAALATGMAIWPAAAAAVVTDVQLGAADRPAATLPEWPDLLPDLEG
jgi:hypothetical protein